MPRVFVKSRLSSDVKLEPRSVTIVFGSPCFETISLIMRFATSFDVVVAMKGAPLVNRSTITSSSSIEFKPFDVGKGPTKSIDTSVHGLCGTGRDSREP